MAVKTVYLGTFIKNYVKRGRIKIYGETNKIRKSSWRIQWNMKLTSIYELSDSTDRPQMMSDALIRYGCVMYLIYLGISAGTI